MLSIDIHRMSVGRAFWSGAVRAFDLFGLLWDENPPLDPEAARRADFQALKADWEAVHGDMAAAWKVMEPELRDEIERTA